MNETAKNMPLALLALASSMAIMGCQGSGSDTTASEPAAAADMSGQDASAMTSSDMAPDTTTTDALASDANNAPANADTDQTFYKEALQGGVAEVGMSEYAQDHATSNDVKALAGLLVRDHTALNEKLRSGSGMSRNPPMTADQQSDATRLRSLSGTAFDTAWLEHMAMGHTAAIAKYEAAASGASTEQARTLAANALPNLRMHLESIERLRGTGPAATQPDRN